MSLTDFGISDGLFFVIRIIATIGGAVVGWFVCDPLTRVVYWIATRASAPGLLLFAVKAAGSISLAVAVFLLMVFAGGGGGLGFGPGKGGLPGKGPGEGGGKGDGVVQNKDNTKPDPDKNKTPGNTPKTSVRSVVEIEILGGAKYPGEDRYYQVKKSDSDLKFVTTPQSLKELEPILKEHKEKIEIKINRTDDSVNLNNDMDPMRRLQKLAKSHDIPSR